MIASTQLINNPSDPENASQGHKNVLVRWIKGLCYYIMVMTILQMIVTIAALAQPCHLGIFFSSFTPYANGFWIALPVSSVGSIIVPKFT